MVGLMLFLLFNKKQFRAIKKTEVFAGAVASTVGGCIWISSVKQLSVSSNVRLKSASHYSVSHTISPHALLDT